MAIVGAAPGRRREMNLVEVVEDAVDRIEDGAVRVVFGAALLVHEVVSRRVLERDVAEPASGIRGPDVAAASPRATGRASTPEGTGARARSPRARRPARRSTAADCGPARRRRRRPTRRRRRARRHAGTAPPRWREGPLRLGRAASRRREGWYTRRGWTPEAGCASPRYSCTRQRRRYCLLRCGGFQGRTLPLSLDTLSLPQFRRKRAESSRVSTGDAL